MKPITAAFDEPFRGITTDGTVRRDVLSYDAGGVSTAPIVDAARAFAFTVLVVEELLRSFKKKGINCFVNTKVEKVAKTKDGVSVSFTPQGEQQQKLEAEKVLVAVGRGPNTEKIGLEKLPNINTERGFVH